MATINQDFKATLDENARLRERLRHIEKAAREVADMWRQVETTEHDPDAHGVRGDVFAAALTALRQALEGGK